MANPSTVTAEIDVDAPIQAVYNQWTQFESFPHFLHAVKEVTQQDDARSHWVVSVGGVRREFDAEIMEQIPDKLVSWASVDGKSHSGSVRFTPAGDGGTNVSLEMMWLPETFVEKVGAALNLDERQAKMDLERFKSFIEERGRETGGWRGEIHDGVAEPEGSSQGTWTAGSAAAGTGAAMGGTSMGDDTMGGSTTGTTGGMGGSTTGSGMGTSAGDDALGRGGTAGSSMGARSTGDTSIDDTTMGGSSMEDALMDDRDADMGDATSSIRKTGESTSYGSAGSEGDEDLPPSPDRV
jgi:uncharacterized protein YndB with AHSA1/START domain